MKKLLLLFVLGGVSFNAGAFDLLDKNKNVIKSKKDVAIANGKKLIKAAMLGKVPKVKRLLKTNFFPGLKDSSGNTALLYACMNATEGRDIQAYNKIATLLINDKEPVNVVGSYKMTPLLWAVMNNQKSIVKLLLKKGADVNVVNSQGYTPLALAAVGAHPEVLRKLLESGKIKVNRSFHDLLKTVKASYEKDLNSHPPKQFEKNHKAVMRKLHEVIKILKNYIKRK